MKPTVSDRMKLKLSFKSIRRTEVSSVAKSMFLTKTSLSAPSLENSRNSPFIVVDLPALVQPTRATLGMRLWLRRAALISSWPATAFNSFLMAEICLPIVRRFNSSLLSPAPRLAKPPPRCWSKLFSEGCKRGSSYCSRASCTCNLACLVRALLEKISRINSVRSITRILVNFSKLRIWTGVNSSFKTNTLAFNP